MYWGFFTSMSFLFSSEWQYLCIIYDSNYGGKQQYIDVKRSKIFNYIEGNDKNNYQYKFTYNGKNVAVSVSIPNVDVNL